MGWGLARMGNSSAAAVAAAAAVAPGGEGGGSKWKSQNRVGFLGNRVKSKEKAHESAKNEKNGI